MESESSIIIQLLPLIGVLAGGFIALISTLFARYLGFKLDQKKEDRKLYREKLERAYIVLSQIRHDYVEVMGKCHLKISYGKDFESKKMGVPSPISEIAMLTKLYFPTLLDTHKEFQNTIDSFGNTLAKIITTKSNQLDFDSQKELNTEVALKFRALDLKINTFQDQLSDVLSDLYKT